MTEKRFNYVRGNGFHDYGGYLSPYVVEALLNELHEENKELRKALTELKEIGDYQANRIKELQEFEDIVFNSLNGKIKRGEKAIEWTQRGWCGMTEKSPLRKIRDIKQAQIEIEKEIENEIKSIFKELDCDGLDRIAFWDYDIWIHLKTSCLIPTDLFSSLNRYFRTSGGLSYSDGDGFVITFKF